MASPAPAANWDHAEDTCAAAGLAAQASQCLWRAVLVMLQLSRVGCMPLARREDCDGMATREIEREGNVSWRTVRTAADSVWHEPRKSAARAVPRLMPPQRGWSGCDMTGPPRRGLSGEIGRSVESCQFLRVGCRVDPGDAPVLGHEADRDPSTVGFDPDRGGAVEPHQHGLGLGPLCAGEHRCHEFGPVEGVERRP